MNRVICLTIAVVSFSVCGADWLRFRGVDGAGAATGAPPTQWSKDNDVAWSIKTPGRGVSSPIIVDGRVILTANEGAKQDRLLVLAFSVKSGDLLWRREFWATGRTATHETSANAAPSPASDGERIYAFYSSNDLICLDLDGNLQWFRGLAHDYPKAGNDVGMAASPVVVDNTVVVQVENQGDSFAASLDKFTGETKWRVKRPAVANWSSPIAMPSSDRKKNTVLLQSGNGLTAHDTQTGAQLWEYKQPCQTVSSASTSPGLVYLPSNGLTVLSVADDSSSPEVVWESRKVNPNPASPIIGGNRVFAVSRGGVITCADRSNGDILWQHRVRGTYWATPVLANGHLYATSQDGRVFVVDVRGGKKAKTVFDFETGEGILASPAVAGDSLFIRSATKLWKISSN